MAKQTSSATVRDILDGQPSIVLLNGHLATFDNAQRKYVDTGIKVTPDDEASAVKFFKLSNSSEVPEAPSVQSGWKDLASLNNALRDAGWDENPLSPSAENRYLFMSVYGRETRANAEESARLGSVKFDIVYTHSTTILYSNFAPSPVIRVEDNQIIITNPDGTELTQQFATQTGVQALLKLIQGLQKQVDKAIYMYRGTTPPTIEGYPTTTWLADYEGKDMNDRVVADIYSTHVGDGYTDISTGFVYNFGLVGTKDPTNPNSYEWAILPNNALTKAISQLAKMDKDRLKIFTEQPTEGYKKGDMWLNEGTGVAKVAIKDNTTFDGADWVNPYVSLSDFAEFKKEYTKLLESFKDAQKGIDALGRAMRNFEGEIGEAFKDNLISEAEKRDMTELGKNLDIEQAKLLSSVNILLENSSLPSGNKEDLKRKSDALLKESTGSIDTLQATINKIIADNVIEPAEREEYNAKYDKYKADILALTKAMNVAEKTIQDALKNIRQPRPNDHGTWDIWDENTSQYKDSNVPTKGKDGKSVTMLGDWKTGLPVPYLGVVRMGKYSFMCKIEQGTDNPPMYTLVDNDGNRIIYRDNKDWGYILTGEINEDEYEIVAKDGEDGIGRDGKDAITYYTWLRFADDAKGNGISDSPVGKEYMGFAYNKTTQKESNTPSDYQWVKIKGETGGIGNPGKDGKTTYTWVAYSDHSDGSNMYQVPNDDTLYIGIAVNKDSNIESDNPADYTWSRFKGGQGIPGESAISISLNTKGAFKTRYVIADESGRILPEPKPIRYIVGGVNIAEKDYVQVSVLIRKGSEDITERAIKKCSATWKINGNEVAKGVSFVNLSTEYADGIDDNIEFEYDDTNIKEW